MLWQTARRTFDLTHRGLIMGVLNITPDSFSDGGQFVAPAHAIARACNMVAAGAEIIDIGGESTRPGAEPVSVEEELRRILPVVEALAATSGVAISIDTSKAEVAAQAVAAGAEIVNDITGLRSAEMRAVVAETGAGAIAMHMQGEPRTMQDAPVYGNVVEEIRDSFRQILAASVRSGIEMMRLAFDPGIGFGKTVGHNLSVLQNLQTLEVEGRPLVLGVSRKSFLGRVVGSTRVEDRAWPTVAVTSHARSRGVRVFRVHDVSSNLHALRMTESLLPA